MRALAAFAVLFLFACGEPQTEGGESGLDDPRISAPESSGSEIVGVYQMVSLDGQPLPHKGLSGGLMEFRSDGIWELSASYSSLSAPITSSGQFSVGERKEGCVEVVNSPDDWPDRPDTLQVCDGVFTLKPSSSGWSAVFEKGQ